MIVICKQTYTMHFVYYYTYEDAMMCFWLCFTLVKLMLIPHIECILFWIYNFCKLVKVSSNTMIVQKVHWIWANSLIIHEIVCIQWISLILTFLTIVYLPFAKSEVSLTTLCWECIIYQVKSCLSHINSGKIH